MIIENKNKREIFLIWGSDNHDSEISDPWRRLVGGKV